MNKLIARVEVCVCGHGKVHHDGKFGDCTCKLINPYHSYKYDKCSCQEFNIDWVITNSGKMTKQEYENVLSCAWAENEEH